MSKIKRTLAVLLAAVMILGMLPVMTSAAIDTTGEIVTNKSYDATTGMLTLEAYATGESLVIETVQPIDVVLVLDVSGSMDEGISYQEVYDDGQQINKNGEYYWLDGTEYKRVYHCDGDILGGIFCDGGWFTEEHYLGDHNNGTELIPKTSSDDADASHVQFYRNKSKLEALKEAACEFVDLVASKSSNDSVSNIAIVKFAGEENYDVGNGFDGYEFWGQFVKRSNYSQIVMDLTRADTGSETLKSTINSLEALGATRADFGMSRAKAALAKSNSGNKQVVIMFTDGSPTSSNGFEDAVASAAIRTSAEMKADDVTVYTIGCFDDADSSEISNRNSWNNLSDVNKYMNLVSSNFNSNAKGMNANFNNYSYGGYYKTASNSSELSNVFTTIGEEIGGTAVTLTETAVLKDVVSEYFEIPVGATVTAHTETCTAIDANGKPTGWKNDGNSLGVNVDGKTVTVTGFDYSKNWVGSHNGAAGGKKVVLEIEIEDNGTGFGFVPTNTEDSGIYKNASATEPTTKFEIPETEFPYYTVKHVQGETVVSTEKVRMSATANLTALVSNGYLYGGAFSDAACSTVYPFTNNENGLSFTPVKGATYYIKEVINDYLRPKTLTLWHTKSNGLVDVNAAYFVAVIDSVNYQEVGFATISENNGNVSFDNDKENKVKNLGGTNIFQQIELTNKKGEKTIYTPKQFYEGKVETGYLACSSIAKSEWVNAGDTITYTPYWITLDGVKVYGTTTRTIKYLGEGNKNFEKVGNDEENNYACEPEVLLTAATPLTLKARFVSDGSEFLEPVAPPEDPDPIIPVKSTYTVTVHDNGEVYEVEVKKNAEAEIDYSGTLFAGWFTDEAYTEPADLSEITSDIDIYAKYVSNDYLCTKYIEQGWFRVYGMTLISALDSDNYADAGFVINGKKISCDYSESYGSFTARALFGSNIARGAKLMTYSLSLKAASNGDKFEVTPYWVTLDGTTVYGTTRTFTYNSRGIKG